MGRPAGIRQKATIYVRWRDGATGQVKPMRRVLSLVNVSGIEETAVMQTGVLGTTKFKYVVFEDPNYKWIPLHEWLDKPLMELDDFWSADRISPASIFVPYETTHEFNFTTAGSISTVENTFVNNTPDAVRISSISDNMKGVRGKHITLM